VSTAVSSSGMPRSGGRRAWLAAAGAALVVACLVPPVATLAARYVLAESVQFAVFSMAGPALIVLGAPWRVLRLSRAPAAAPAPATRGGQAVTGPGPADRLAAARRGQGSFRRAGLFLLAFMALTLAWRLPPLMDALARQPILVLAQLVTLVPAGLGVWLELLASPPLQPRLPRPQRAAIAALAMWFTWGVAYVIGFHNGTVFAAYGSVPGRALSLVADQELSVILLWAVAGLCFIPVVFAAMLGWLRDGDPDEELQRMVRDSGQRAVVKGWGPPARNWGRPPQRRHRSAG
jgi:cytochrome c oxidase assembly factor CtaG